MKTKVTRWGNSLAVRIPKPVAEAAELRQGDELVIEISRRGNVQVRKAKSKLTLAELVRGITPENCHRETDWGETIGRETW